MHSFWSLLNVWFFQAEKGVLLGKVFAYLAIIKSCNLNSVTQSIKLLFEGLMKLSKMKSYLRPVSVHAISELIQKVSRTNLFSWFWISWFVMQNEAKYRIFFRRQTLFLTKFCGQNLAIFCQKDGMNVMQSFFRYCKSVSNVNQILVERHS